MSSNIRETLIALSYRKQAALQTKPADGTTNYWALTKTNPALAAIDLQTEDDSADIGKGDEFAQNVFLTNWDARIPFEKYVSSECLAWGFVFALGNFSKSAAGSGFLYTCTPLNPITDGIELPQFTYVEAIRQGGSPTLDRAAIGCVINSMTLTMSSGPGRANCRVAFEFVGCGKNDQPGAITVPTVTQEHFLNAGSAGITIIGQDYIALKSLISLEIGINNNIRLDQGFFPGSGTDTGAAIRGRMENGDRAYSLRWTVRLAAASPELAALKAGTEGTAVVTLTGATTGGVAHGASITFWRVRVKGAVIGDDAGIVTVACEAAIMKETTNGVITAAVTTAQNNIGSAAA